MLRRAPWLLLLASVLLLVAVVVSPQRSVRADPVPVRVAAAHNDTSTPFNLVSLPALIEHEYDGRGLRVHRLVSADLLSTRHAVSYRSGDLRITGQLFRPRRPGRFPLVVLAHGYEAPAIYRSGAALAREQRLLAARGFVVLLPDYRNYGGSDREGADVVERPLGYPEDLVNAILAMRRAHLPFVDTSRVAVVGRSMGGGVALNAVAARPGLVDALVLYSSVSSTAADNYRRWVRGRGELDSRVRETYGAPARNPQLWREASVRNYLGRIDVPVQVHHGIADPVTPIAWSRATVTALRQAGQAVEYHEYPGELHRLREPWPRFAQRMTRFLDAHL